MNTKEIKKILEDSACMMKLELYILSLPFTGYWFYRRNCGVNHLFCQSMCAHFVFRMLYAVLFASGISVFNLLYVMVTNDFTASGMTVAVSTLVLCGGGRHPVLTALGQSKGLASGLALVSLAAVFTSRMLPFAFSLYLLLVAAAFYPSRRAMENFRSSRCVQYYSRYPALLVEAYFN